MPSNLYLPDSFFNIIVEQSALPERQRKGTLRDHALQEESGNRTSFEDLESRNPFRARERKEKRVVSEQANSPFRKESELSRLPVSGTVTRDRDTRDIFNSKISHVPHIQEVPFIQECVPYIQEECVSIMGGIMAGSVAGVWLAGRTLTVQVTLLLVVSNPFFILLTVSLNIIVRKFMESAKTRKRKRRKCMLLLIDSEHSGLCDRCIATALQLLVLILLRESSLQGSQSDATAQTVVCAK